MEAPDSENSNILLRAGIALSNRQNPFSEDIPGIVVRENHRAERTTAQALGI